MCKIKNSLLVLLLSVLLPSAVFANVSQETALVTVSQTDVLATAFNISEDPPDVIQLTIQEMKSIKGERGHRTLKKGSKKRLHNKHTDRRSGRLTTKQRSHSTWRSYRIG